MRLEGEIKQVDAYIGQTYQLTITDYLLIFLCYSCVFLLKAITHVYITA